MQINDLITSDYCEQNRAVFNTSKRSMGGAKHAELVAQLAVTLKANSILDYGCGQGQFKPALELQANIYHKDWEIKEYDPCIYEKDILPEKADIICCADVLEHVEEDKIDNVLEHIFELMQKGGYFVIALCPTRQLLPDGRNAHVLLKPIDWWLQKLMAFDVDINHCSVRIKKREIKDIVIWLTKKQ